MTDPFIPFRKSIAESITRHQARCLFMTDLHNTDLYSIFLDNLPAEYRQEYTCFFCKTFMNAYGCLVTIDPKTTEVVPLLWDETGVEPLFAKASAALYAKVKSAKITGVVMTSKPYIGKQNYGGFDHLYLEIPPRLRYSGGQRLGAVIGEKNQGHVLLTEAVRKYTAEQIEQAAKLLASWRPRYDKQEAQVQWFLKVRNGPCTENMLRYEAAVAPTGYTHISNSVVGELLKDIKAHKTPKEMQQHIDTLMNSLTYQRSSAAPKGQTIVRAQELFEEMGLAPALDRRFARMEEVRTLWRDRALASPQEEEENPVPTSAAAEQAPPPPPAEPLAALPATLTFAAFRTRVLPRATSIEFFVPRYAANYGALLTACDPEAPPILRWDEDERRNPFSWYLHAYGTAPTHWHGLAPEQWTRVSGIALQPNQWFSTSYDDMGKGAFFILHGMHEKEENNVTLSLFPEMLRTELREVRSVIASISQGTSPAEREKGTACGIFIQNDSEPYKFRVHAAAAGAGEEEEVKEFTISGYDELSATPPEQMHRDSIRDLYYLLILDRSGSMSGVTGAVIAGYNSVISQLQAMQLANPESHYYSSLLLFDNIVPGDLEVTPVAEVQPLTSATYYARGCTALYDAVERGLSVLKKKIPASTPPPQVRVLVFTDGEDNSSRTRPPQVAQLVATLQRQGWAIGFRGSHTSAARVASSLGMGGDFQLIEQSSAGLTHMFAAEATALRSMLRPRSQTPL